MPCAHTVNVVDVTRWTCVYCGRPMFGGHCTAHGHDAVCVVLPPEVPPFARVSCEDCGEEFLSASDAAAVPLAGEWRDDACGQFVLEYMRMGALMGGADHYTLDDRHRPQRCDSAYLWAKWMRQRRNIVRLDELPDGTVLHTLFLGLVIPEAEAAGARNNKPVFETWLFPAAGEQRMLGRYDTFEEAEAGHARTLAYLAQPPVRVIALEDQRR